MSEQNLTPSKRGGKRPGAGRPKGTKKEPTEVYYRRVKPEWIPLLDKLIEELKTKKEPVD